MIQPSAFSTPEPKLPVAVAASCHRRPTAEPGWVPAFGTVGQVAVELVGAEAAQGHAAGVHEEPQFLPMRGADASVVTPKHD